MRLFLRFLTFLRPYRWRLALAFALILVSTALVVVSAWIFRHLLNTFSDWSAFAAAPRSPEALRAYSRDVIKDAFLWGGAVVAVTLLRTGVSAWRVVVAGTAAQRVIFDIRNRLVDRLMRLSLRFHEGHPTGQLMSRATSDVDALHLLVTSATVDILSDAIQVLVLGAVLVWISPSLALLTVLLTPLMVGATALFGRRMRRISRAVQAQLAVVASQLLEMLAGIRVVMGFNAERRERRRFYRANARALRLNLRRLWLQNLWSASVESSVMVAVVALAVAGIREIVNGRMDLGQAGMFGFLLLTLPMPLQRIAIFVDTLQRGLAAAERVFEVLDSPIEVQSLPGARRASRVCGDLRFEGVGFAYEPGHPVLSEVTLDIPGGSTVALVGPSGAGKSTLANLLARFYDPTEGRILVDGRDIREHTLDSWRRQIGFVFQDTFLFSGNVLDNIAIGHGNASEEEIMRAARAAHVDEFARNLPDGYQTAVGERGMHLSGGQRQRIALARAILRNAPILVLDEATSSLDSESERYVQAALDTLLEGRTALIIAHRLSTIRRADRIVVMAGGRIVDVGTYEELVARGGLFARLHALQFEEPNRRPYAEPDIREL